MGDTPNPRAGVPRATGGEWQLLRARLASWLDGVDAEQLWVNTQGPLKLLGILLAASVVLKVYGALLETIAGVPLMSGLLELSGLIWLTRYANAHLLRSDDRRQTLAAFAQRWRRFQGRD